MPVQILPITMTIQRAAAETGIPRSNLYELWRRGEIEIRKSGRRSLVTGESMTGIWRTYRSLKNATLWRLSHENHL
jgi:hypothetical protein